jgi:hypothetical protein
MEREVYEEGSQLEKQPWEAHVAKTVVGGPRLKFDEPPKRPEGDPKRQSLLLSCGFDLLELI